MKTPHIAAAAALIASFALAACEPEPKTLTVDTRARDPRAAEVAAARERAIELPPAVKANVTFRCKDNSLVYVDFFGGDMLVNFRAEKAEAPVQLKAATVGEPFIADGYELTGTESNITVTTPSKPSITCRA